MNEVCLFCWAVAVVLVVFGGGGEGWGCFMLEIKEEIFDPISPPTVHPSPFISLCLARPWVWRPRTKHWLCSPESLCIASAPTYVTPTTITTPPPPSLPPSLPLFFSLSLPLFALVVRHVRGIPGHSCHVKECSQTTEDGSLFIIYLFIYLFIFSPPPIPTPHSKHLNMHHPLLTLNHEVGSEMNLALRSHARKGAHVRTYSLSPLFTFVYAKKGERARNKKAGAQWHSMQTRVIHRQVPPQHHHPTHIHTHARTRTHTPHH